jgi:hypothetical protein
MNDIGRAVPKSGLPFDLVFSILLIATLAGIAFLIAAGLGIVPIPVVTDFVDHVAHIHD